MRKIILHMFQYPIRDIIKFLPEIKTQGFTDIQISPIQPLKQDDGPWWILYQPISFSIGNTMIGNKDELIDLCTKARDYGIGIICDVICNHMASSNTGEIIPNEKVDKLLIETKEFWKDNTKIQDWKNRWDVTHKSIGLPGLDLSNNDLQKIVLDFLTELLECGVSGFRFDAAKNIQLPDEGSSFWENIPREYCGRKIFNYAEIIFEDKILLDRYSRYVNILSEGSCTNKSKMVTFVESHDSFFEFKYTAKMQEWDIIREWRHLLQDNKEWSVIYYCRPWVNWWTNPEIGKINKELI